MVTHHNNDDEVQDSRGVEAIFSYCRMVPACWAEKSDILHQITLHERKESYYGWMDGWIWSPHLSAYINKLAH